MVTVQNFGTDLKRGKVYEQLSLKLLQKLKWEVTEMIYEGNADESAKWDIHAKRDDKEVYIEVKFDEASKKWGNIAIDIRTMEHTTSDIFLTYYYNKNGDELYLLKTPTQNIQELLQQLKEEGRYDILFKPKNYNHGDIVCVPITEYIKRTDSKHIDYKTVLNN